MQARLGSALVNFWERRARAPGARRDPKNKAVLLLLEGVTRSQIKMATGQLWCEGLDRGLRPPPGAWRGQNLGRAASEQGTLWTWALGPGRRLGSAWGCPRWPSGDRPNLANSLDNNHVWNQYIWG